MFNRPMFFSMIIFLLCTNSYAQERNDGISQLPAPRQLNPLPPSVQLHSPNNWYTRVFAYNAYGGSISTGPFKMWLNGTGITPLGIDPTPTNFIQAASFCGADGIWYGIRYGTNALVKTDTSNGTITQIAIVTGANSITGIAWDFTTNTMYALDYSSGASRVGTLNLTTGAFTGLTGTFPTGIPIDMACSNNGTLYAHVITSPTTPSQIYSVNKTTGVFTALPQTTGFNANYSQGMGWDHSVDSGYLFAYNYTTSTGELRKIDIATGFTTLIASIGVEADGVAIPGFPGPQIIHTPYQNTQSLTGPYIQNAIISPVGSGINPYWTKIFWSRNNPVVTDSIQMTKTSGTNWTGNIPGNGTTATYRYYIRTADSADRFSTSPSGAPANLYSFLASTNDTSKPIILHTPLGNCQRNLWPATVSCAATETFGIDSVWVRWNINSGTYDRFNLSYGNGNNWSAPFNSTSSQVYPGDIIHYRIIARSASTQHTMDSTALYSFYIINQTIFCIGTGTTSSNYPFTTYWEDGRTDILLLSSEIIAAGGYSSLLIGIGFNVISVGGPAMSAFNIKMQYNSATSITAFTNSGWTTCYNGTYTVPGTGWQYINFTTPFYWQNNQNLLIEVCYNNNAWTAYSPVNATASTGMMVGYSTDLPAGDGCTEPTWIATSLSYRPNICLLTYTEGIVNNNNENPDKFSLSQNYPNPFNPNTKIDYAIPKKGFVSLKIYDVLGREVKTLVNENKTPGNYSIDFIGSEFSSGVYFYKLVCNEFSDIKRMILIK